MTSTPQTIVSHVGPAARRVELHRFTRKDIVE